MCSCVDGFYDKTLSFMHIGNLIRQKVREQNKTSDWLAEQLSCSRTNVYKLYDKKSIDTDILFRISSILKFDFFSIYSEEVLQKGLSHGTRQNRDCPWLVCMQTNQGHLSQLKTNSLSFLCNRNNPKLKNYEWIQTTNYHSNSG